MNVNWESFPTYFAHRASFSCAPGWARSIFSDGQLLQRKWKVRELYEIVRSALRNLVTPLRNGLACSIDGASRGGYAAKMIVNVCNFDMCHSRNVSCLSVIVKLT